MIEDQNKKGQQGANAFYHRLNAIHRFKLYGLSTIARSWDFILALAVGITCGLILFLTRIDIEFRDICLAYLAIGISIMGILISSVSIFSAINDIDFVRLLSKVKGFENFILTTLELAAIVTLLTIAGSLITIFLSSTKQLSLIKVLFSATTFVMVYSLFLILNIIQYMLKNISIKNELQQNKLQDKENCDEGYPE